MAFTGCILFTRYTREQNTTCKGHLAFQKATISLENDVHSFFPSTHFYHYECKTYTVFFRILKHCVMLPYAAFDQY